MMFSLHFPSLYSTYFITITLFLITLPPNQVSSLGIGSTITVSTGFLNSICGILSGESQSISCYIEGQILAVSPANVSYDSISGGEDFFCGLTSGGFTIHCWNIGFSADSFQTKIVYDNATAPLTDLSVGELHICALHAVTGTVHCWQKNQNASASPFTLPKQSTQFISTTSGNGFSCGIVKESRFVNCWGENGTSGFIQSEFGNLSMLTLVAGENHVCGLTVAGVLVCKGSNAAGQLNVPPNEGFRLSSIALGENHTCAILNASRTAVCWGGDNFAQSMEFMDLIVASYSFYSIAAGLDFTCGLGTDLGMICWGPGWPTTSSFSMSEIPLPTVIPGPCVKDPCGTCGSYPNSTALCGNKGATICMSCEIPLPPPSVPSTPQAQPHSGPVSESSDSSGFAAPSAGEAYRNKLYLPLEIIGSVLFLAALISSVFIVRKKLSDRRKEPLLDATASNVALNNARDSALGSYPSSALNSRSSSVNRSNSVALASTRSMSLRPGNKAEKFSFTMLADATENFSPDNIVGSGTFGTVYKGRLSDGRPVAIKREEMVNERRMKVLDGDDSAFDSDLELISKLHHKHLVGLLGFFKDKEERLLIYEYMSNGALHDHLHTDKGDTTLNSWRTRVKVALDAARGIEYLHNYAVPHIIHGDIKPSNILIDSNGIGRVSDFGLSLMGSLSEQDDPSAFITETAGTAGYIDPEFYVSKVLTTKSDVYGFGVVILELLTGKKAVFRDVEGMEPISIAEYAAPYINGGEVWKVLDKRISYPLLHEAEAVELLSSTALRCVSSEGKERPTMSEVVANLEKAFIICKEYPATDDISRNASFASFSK